MSRSNAPNQVPSIRPTQFENGDINSLKNSVNLFRGDVNLQKTLVTLPGKVDDDTLQVAVNILYQSNVHEQVTTWNLDAPTGVLGLGWSLDTVRIVANSNGALSQASLQYVYQSGGTSNQLFGCNTPWIRGMLDASLASMLSDTMTPQQIQQLVAAFAATGLSLSPHITVTMQGNNAWQVDDQGNEHLWQLSIITKNGKQAVQVTDGGQAFELQNFQFWKIYYYSAYERWEITDTSGAVQVFGGGQSQNEYGFMVSNGNSIEWGVKWGEDGSWAGSANCTNQAGNNQQCQYATAWNLSAKIDRYGSQVTYEYNGFPLDAEGTISMGAEQLVTTGGKPFTKACYITRITDAFGHEVNFNYGYKTFTDAAQEYLDPHYVLVPASAPNTLPANFGTPNGFQDQYEVLLLTDLEVQSPDLDNPGQYNTVFGLRFSYTPPQNISVTPTQQQAVMCKSYLQGITWYNAAGQTLPGYSCTYYMDDGGGQNPNPGALESITYPEGSTGTFTYGSEELPICDRRQLVVPPSEMRGQATQTEDELSSRPEAVASPRVWFGDDYAVTLFISHDATQVSMEVHTWVGHWARWTPENQIIYDNSSGNSSGDVDPNSFQVIANSNAFLLSFKTAQNTYLYIFNRDTHLTSRWMELDYKGASFLTFPDADSVSFTAGDNFVLAMVMSGTSNPVFSLYRFTYDWRNEQLWSGLDSPLEGFANLSTPLFALAQSEYYLLLQYDAGQQSTLGICYLDQYGNWNAGARLSLTLDLSQNNKTADGTAQMVWASGPSLAAYTVASEQWTANGANYSLNVLRWDANYNFEYQQSYPALQESPVHQLQDNPAWPPSPRIIGNDSIGCLSTICRFEGNGWTSYTFPPSDLIGSAGWATYAYGQDFTLQVMNTTEAIKTWLMPYDPPGGGFATTPQFNDYSTGPVHPDMGYPSASGDDYFCAANGIFYRGFSTSWANAFQSPIFPPSDDLSDFLKVNTVSLINESPNFMAYLVPGAQAQDTEVQLLVLQNGGVDAAPSNLIPRASYFTVSGAGGGASSPEGQYPAGTNQLATFPAGYGQFQAAPGFTLHRYAGYKLSGSVQSFPVQSLEINVWGSENLYTCYEFKAASANCDPSGQVVKYYQSAVYGGCATPAASRFGRTVSIYQNGISEGYSMLDGQPLQTICFEGAALFETEWNENLGLDPKQPLNQKKPIPQSLYELFPSGTLSPSATLEYVEIAYPQDAQATGAQPELLEAQGHLPRAVQQGYRYWIIEDVEDQGGKQYQKLYNIDYDGNPASSSGVRAFTGRVVKYSANRWKLFTHRNGNPLTPEPIKLHGGYVLPVAQTTFSDGVALVTHYGYLPRRASAPETKGTEADRQLMFPFTGGVQDQAWAYPSVKGAREYYLQESIFGAQVYPQLVWGNVLTPVAQLRTRWRVEKKDWLTLAASANTWKDWQSAQGINVCDTQSHYAWKGDSSGVDTGDFPFNGTPSAELWLPESQTTVRAGNGVVTESVDVTGLTHSTVLDNSGENAVTIASNASYAGEEVDYCGFEADEDVSTWTLTGGAKFATGNAHTGAKSLHLPSSGAAAQRAPLTPTKNNRVYILSCWYQIGGDSSASGAGITIQVTQGGKQVGDFITLPFKARAGLWDYAHAVIDLGAYLKQAGGSGTLSINISTEMGDAPEMWIDDVCFGPRSCTFMAQVHSSLTGQATANLSLNGKTWRHIRDPYYRLMGKVGPDGRAHGVKLTYYSLQGNPGGFSLTDPNTSLKVKAMHGGSAQSFLNGDGWQHLWKPDNASAWSSDNGLLTHAANTTSDTLTSISPVEDEYALYLELLSASGQSLQLGSGFELSIGDAANLSWNGSRWSLTIGDDPPQSSLNPAADSPASLMLILTGSNLIFFADGQLLFSTSTTVKGVPKITTGNNALALRNLILLSGPSIQLKQQDATGQDRQVHILAGSDYFVNQNIGDEAGHRSVKTKAIPGTYGLSGALPPLQYRPSLVDLQAFQSTVNTTGQMTGDVADYYNGTNGTTNDANYPYTRYRFEASPLNRVVEIGSPGADYAIIENTPIEKRQTIRYGFSSNAEVTLPSPLKIPAGQYRVTTRLDQANAMLLTVDDAVSNTVAKISGDESQWVINLTSASYNAHGAQTSIVLPSSFQPDAAEQAIVKTYNVLGQLVQETDPDSGATQYIYNNAGQIRFMQDADGTDKGYAIYFLYDELGRKLARGAVQIGTSAGAFSQLSEKADLPAYPEDDEGVPAFTRFNNWVYDGDGTDANALGYMVAALSYNNGLATVEEKQTWNAQGNLKAQSVKTVWADGTTDGPFSMQYDYDNQGNLTFTGYPELTGVTLKGAAYLYNGLGQLQSIRDQDNNVLASYQYNAAGQPAIMNLGSLPIVGSLGYDSPGHFCDVSASFEQSSFSSDAIYNFDGSVKNQTDTLQNAGDASGEFEVTFAYELQNQLGGASNSAQPSWSQSFDYTDPATKLPDLNGNIHAIQPSGDAFEYQTANQLKQVSWGAGGETSFAYNDNGAVYQRTSQNLAQQNIPDLTIEYLPSTTLPATITIGDGSSLNFVYDSSGNRIGKRVYDGATLTGSTAYVPGPYRPFAQVDQSGNGIAYVYGVNGLTTMFRDNACYMVATDRLGSIRMVFNADGSVAAAYNFLSYGALASSQEPSAGWMPLLFTGMEQDQETGLYNFNARLYDPLIGRFYATDAEQQFPSPYIYTGNHPTLFNDPTGMITQGEQAGIGLAAGAVAIAGFGISMILMSLMPEAIPAVAALVYADAGVITSVGTSALTYDVEHNPDNWSWGQFFEMAALGAITGAISGGISGGISQIGVLEAGEQVGSESVNLLASGGGVEEGSESIQVKSFKETWDGIKSRADKSWKREGYAVAYKMSGRMAGYTISGIVYNPLGNIIEGNSWHSWLGVWIPVSFLQGLVLGVGSSLGSVAEDAFQISSNLKSGFKYLLNSPKWGITAAITLPLSYCAVGGGAFIISNNLWNQLIGETGTSKSSK